MMFLDFPVLALQRDCAFKSSRFFAKFFDPLDAAILLAIIGTFLSLAVTDFDGNPRLFISAQKGKRTCEVDILIRKNTFGNMDAILPVTPAAPRVPSTPTHDELILRAFEASRMSLGWVHWRLGLLKQIIKDADRLDGIAKINALAALRATFSRDIAVLSDKLRTNGDPLSSEFGRALQKALLLIRRNLYEKSLIVDEGTAGRCDPGLWGGAMPFAAATPWDPEPRVSVCAPWFPMNADLHRDVITHEFFHLVGLIDKPVIANTCDALDDANTMAQLVAYIHDRSRWEDSSGLSKPTGIYPAP